MDTEPAPRTLPAHQCSIHRTLDVIGEKWSLLIVRNAFRGQSRFSEFRDSLGVPSDVLTARLSTLVAAGILERRSYREPGSRERSSYHLTEEGRGLTIVLAALQQWGDEFTPNPGGRVSVIEVADNHEEVALAFVDSHGDTVDRGLVRLAPGPAATISW
ncbi:winged helix-turn-helix transcriptional regulator [Subtercola frigoramans]|uniref:DNA-binding HxlR family transcriptional regulator n=1 Tax=Subtercola frigoramans TaxID=120298 RepID=A0ABS2L2L3_9MICO|nr:helix-turn-helix domain-containing protein [Subtercola frigoramans]MBM7471329.1 DNA-binding HxlR family transcriptional regulator [Subtercola frigoramans]